MSTEPKRSRWMVVAVLVLAACLVVAIVLCLDMDRKLSDRSGTDSLTYKHMQRLTTENHMLRENRDQFVAAGSAYRAEVTRKAAEKEKSWDIERKGYQRRLSMILTRNATVLQLDSMQRGLYGATDSDSTHTIPLDFSRKLTGDALRLPVEHAWRIRTEERMDSTKTTDGQIIASYRAENDTLKAYGRSADITIDSLSQDGAKMQGTIDEKSDENDRFRKGRNKERLIGLILIITALIL